MTNRKAMRDPRYHDAVLFVLVASALGAAGFAFKGWNPVLGLLVGGFPAFIVGAVVIAADDEDKKG